MSVNVEALENLLRSLVNKGARLAVLADLSGLTIANISTTDAKESEDAVSALASLVMGMGDIIGREIGGDFLNATVRAEGGTTISQVIQSTPKTVLLTVTDVAKENQVLLEMNKLRTSIAHSIDGIAVEVEETPDILSKSVDSSIDVFFNDLKANIESAENHETMSKILIDAREALVEVLKRFSPVNYFMGHLAQRIRKSESSIEELKEETAQEIKEWRNRLKKSLESRMVT